MPKDGARVLHIPHFPQTACVDRPEGLQRVKARRKEEFLSEPALSQLWPPGWLKQGSVSSEGGQEAAGDPGGEEEEERQVRGGRTLRAGAPGKCVSLAAALWMVSESPLGAGVCGAEGACGRRGAL